MMQAAEPVRDIEAERCALACVIHNPAALDVILEVLGNEPEAFCDSQDRCVFETMIHLHEVGEPVEAQAVFSALTPEQRRDVPIAFLAELSGACPTSANVRHYAGRVASAHSRRRLFEVGQQIQVAALSAGSDKEALAMAEDLLAGVENGRRRGRVEHIRDVLPGVMQHLVDVAEGRAAAGGVSMGIGPLDDLLGGLHGGDLIIIAARPSVGKTALALSIAHHAATREGVPVLFFSLEMDNGALTQRILAVEGVSLRQIRGRFNTKGQIANLARAQERLTGAPLAFDDVSGATIADIRSKARRFVQEHGAGIVVVDYLQLIRGGPKTRAVDRHLEVAEFSRELKGLARELGSPMVCLSQLNRGAENEIEGSRKLACLRESGAIEQDADVVVILSRLTGKDAQAFEVKHGQGLAEHVLLADVPKHRNGPTGRVLLHFDKDFQRFRALDGQSAPVPEPVDDVPFDGYGGDDTPF